MNDKLWLVSVIMPAYNASAFIADSIDSVLAQTYRNWELIVIDDGSTDSTPDIVKQKACHDVRLKYLYQDNGRQAKARNLGLMHAKGEFIAFLDADDLWLDNKLEIMVNEFGVGNQDLLFSDSYIFESSFSINDASLHHERMGVVAGEYYGYNGLSDFLEINRIPVLTVIAKSDVIKKFIFNEDMTPAEDYDLWLRMLVSGCRLRAIPLPLAAYRLHQASSTSSDRLATDTVIRIIYKLKCSNSNNSIKKLIDHKLRKWLSRKLQSVEDYKQMKYFINILRDMNYLNNMVIYEILNNICNLIFKINIKLLKRILK